MLSKIEFNININATAEKVWQILWNDDTYRKWTAVFAEGSYAKSTWEEGDKVYFLTPKGEGLYSLIEKKTPNKHMSFKHLGMMKDGEEISAADSGFDWEGAYEIYDLSEEGGNTSLTATIYVWESDKAYFEKTFPLAMEEVKKLAEG